MILDPGFKLSFKLMHFDGHLDFHNIFWLQKVANQFETVEVSYI